MALESLKELMDGWIVRKGDFFTTAFLDSTLSWEDKINIEEVPFIQYIIKTMRLDKFYSSKELLRIKAFAFAKNMLHGIDVNTLEHRLTISEGNDSYTDGRNIVISGKYLDIKETKDYNNMDVFIGVTLHEGCHVLYTDFKLYVEFIKSKDLPSGAAELFKTMVNITEDERIERRLLDRYPGHGNFIARMKEHHFATLVIGREIELAEEENPTEFLNLLLQIIRYPRHINELILERYEPLLYSVKELLMPYPEEMDDLLEKTYEVFELILEYFDLNFEVDPERDSELAELSEELRKSMGDPKGLDSMVDPKEEEGDEKGLSKKEKSKEEAILDGDYSYTDDGLKVLAKPSTKAEYLKILDTVKQYIPGFRHFLYYNTYVKKRNLVGLKSGLLDTNKLADGYQGVDGIYYRKEVQKPGRLTVALLVDMSGSMSGGPIKRARECAVLLTEVFSQNKNCDIYVYGYTGQNLTDEKAELYEFYTPKNPDKTRLVNIKAIAQNLDGYSLLQMREQIRKDIPHGEVLSFMISDGEPSAIGYHGSAAKKHLKECVGILERDNFKIVHIAVGYEGLPDVYKNLVKVEDVSTLANDLYLLVKKTIK